MKQFSLEEFLKNPNRKVVTREGRPVRIICTDFNNERLPVIGEIQGETNPLSFTDKGRFSRYFNDDDSFDLFFAPEMKVGWVNVYHEDNRLKCGNVYNTESEAKLHGRNVNCLATVKIEWEE